MAILNYLFKKGIQLAYAAIFCTNRILEGTTHQLIDSSSTTNNQTATDNLDPPLPQSLVNEINSPVYI
jgi:hypothetical protein